MFVSFSEFQKNYSSKILLNADVRHTGLLFVRSDSCPSFLFLGEIRPHLTSDGTCMVVLTSRQSSSVPSINKNGAIWKRNVQTLSGSADFFAFSRKITAVCNDDLSKLDGSKGRTLTSPAFFLCGGRLFMKLVNFFGSTFATATSLAPSRVRTPFKNWFSADGPELTISSAGLSFMWHLLGLKVCFIYLSKFCSASLSSGFGDLRSLLLFFSFSSRALFQHGSNRGAFCGHIAHHRYMLTLASILEFTSSAIVVFVCLNASMKSGIVLS